MEEKNETELLMQLASNIEDKRKQNEKQHNVWELSFDWKDCRSNEFVWQKLDYMHNNPCVGKWQLSINPIEYLHSSAKFYLTGEQGVYAVTNFMEMKEIDFNESRG